MVESVETLPMSEIKKGLILNYCGYYLCNLHTVRVNSIWHSKLFYRYAVVKNLYFPKQ